MSQPTTSETTSSTLSLNISGNNGSGFITMQPQVTPPLKPTAGVNLYSDGNNNVSWRDALGRVCTLDTSALSASRTWSLPDSSSVLATIDTLASKEDKSNKGIPNGYPSLDQNGKIPLTQLPVPTPGIVSVLYATVTVDGPTQVQQLTTVAPSSFSSLSGFAPAAGSDLGVDLATGAFSMDVLGTVYEFKIDAVWPTGADTGERRVISFNPLNGNLVSDQVFYREELGLIESSYKQTISCSPFVHVYELGSSGGFNVTISLDSPNATSSRVVDVRIRVIRWE